jgi:hypothetical protein
MSGSAFVIEQSRPIVWMYGCSSAVHVTIRLVLGGRVILLSRLTVIQWFLPAMCLFTSYNYLHIEQKK